MADSSAEKALAGPLPSRWRPVSREPAGERELIEAAQRGSADALEELVRSSWPNAYRAALVIVGDRAAAEDMAQDALLAALERLDRFNASQPFQPWLHRIVTNKSLDWVRKRSRRARIDATLETPAAPPVGSGDALGLSAEVSAALLSLTPEERAAFVMRHLVGMTSREIAGALDSTPGTIRSMLHRVRERLTAQMDSRAEGEPR